jgi:hypothetical protein
MVVGIDNAERLTDQAIGVQLPFFPAGDGKSRASYSECPGGGPQVGDMRAGASHAFTVERQIGDLGVIPYRHRSDTGAAGPGRAAVDGYDAIFGKKRRDRFAPAAVAGVVIGLGQRVGALNRYTPRRAAA